MQRRLTLRQAYADELKRLFPAVYITKSRDIFSLTVHYRGQSREITAEDMRFERWPDMMEIIQGLIRIGERTEAPNYQYQFVAKYPVNHGMRQHATSGYRMGPFEQMRDELFEQYVNADYIAVTDLQTDKRVVFCKFSKFYPGQTAVWVEKPIVTVSL